jgi:bifunctional non-homologous end joining protein LigD
MAELATYRRKRDFKRTPEPGPKKVRSGREHIFVIQKHVASHLHYDFRLEMNGVLVSWAVPKGPSLDPAVKRLAMHVEDHPYSYKDFEGTIPKGNYGAGEVIVWDNGIYEITDGSYRAGHFSFILYGKKLHGEFSLVRFKGKEEGKKEWLLVKQKDRYASKKDITKDEHSVLSDRSLGNTKESMCRPFKKARITAADLSPMLATLAKEPFDDPKWVYEVKWDGYRLLAYKRGGKLQLISRNGIDVSKKYPVICKALSGIPDDTAIDGELIALDEKGRPRFQLLQEYAERDAPLAYYAFDLLFDRGEDIRELALLERKERLESLLPTSKTIRYSEHIEKAGKKYFAAAKKQGLEGVMAKRADSVYLSGKRSKDWLKFKAVMEQEAVIVGYTEPRGSRKYIGSLVLAVRESGKYIYAGHTGGGMGGLSLKYMYDLLKPTRTDKAPISAPREVERTATWVKPTYVGELRFTEWTRDGQMRHPVFLGLRDDKKPEEVTRERAK